MRYSKIAFLLGVPLSLLVGCENKQGASVDTTSVSAGTNQGVADANNSARNVRDRDNATATPGDQSGSSQDLKTTQAIRQALVSGTNNYSVTARNVKIITANNKVVLRGPVRSPEEKAGIVAIAKSVAGEGNVEDQLEVESKQ